MIVHRPPSDGINAVPKWEQMHQTQASMAEAAIASHTLVAVCRACVSWDLRFIEALHWGVMPLTISTADMFTPLAAPNTNRKANNYVQ